MAEFVGGEPVSVGVNEPITFENKTDTAFDVCCGIVFRKSGLYRVSIVGRHISVAVEPERKRGKWINAKCSACGNLAPFWPMASTYYHTDYCPNCGAKMREDV